MDEIIVLEEGSTDNTKDILLRHGVTKISKPFDGFGNLRKELLRAGRKRGGTHFVFLDADEVFTADLRDGFTKVLSGMKPGEKIHLRWLAMWKSPFVYRDDDSVWSNNFKDFIFCDDGTSDFDDTWIHEPRTPGKNTDANTVRLEKYGGVMHYQFVPWERFQVKQKYYRYIELIRNPRYYNEIIEKYSITKDDPDARLTPIKSSWIEGYLLPRGLEDADGGHYLDEIDRMAQQYGRDFFSILDKPIWKRTFSVLYKKIKEIRDPR